MGNDSVHGQDSLATKHYSTRYVWFVIVLLTLVNVINYVDRMALAVLAPLIKKDMDLSDAQLGLLIGFAFAVFYALCGIPIARWADRGVRRNIIALALATWSIFTALSGAAQNFLHLFAARVGVGAGEAGCFPPASSMLCDYVPLRKRAGVFSVHSFGIYAGMMLGMVLAGWLGESIGWRWTFVAFGLPGIAMAILIRLAVREPQRGYYDTLRAEESSLPMSKTVGVLWRCKTYRLLVLYLVINGFVQYGLNQWWPSFYTRSFGLSLSSAGAYLGLSLGIGSGIGLLAGGLIANKAAQHDVSLPLKIGAVATVLAIPAAMGSLFVSSTMGSFLLVWLTSLLWTVPSGPALAMMYGVTRSTMRATAGALYIFLMSVLGFGLGPFCVGLLSDLFAPVLGTEALRYALIAPICLIPVLTVALYAAARVVKKDLAVIEGQAESSPTIKSATDVGWSDRGVTEGNA
jgi:predicted MFS family arabinose efflux permease